VRSRGLSRERFDFDDNIAKLELTCSWTCMYALY